MLFLNEPVLGPYNEPLSWNANPYLLLLGNRTGNDIQRLDVQADTLHGRPDTPSFRMSSHQSQVSSTRHIPFRTWLKKALRLNRDCAFVFAEMTGTDKPTEEDWTSVTASFDGCGHSGMELSGSYGY